VTGCGVEVFYVKDDPVPSARLLLAAVRHRPRSGAPRTAQEARKSKVCEIRPSILDWGRRKVR
jgi:hypothetical protein